MTDQATPANLDSLEGEEAEVACWRFSQLCDAGFDMAEAELLAMSGCDLHVALDMLSDGVATHKQILQILL